MTRRKAFAGADRLPRAAKKHPAAHSGELLSPEVVPPLRVEMSCGDDQEIAEMTADNLGMTVPRNNTAAMALFDTMVTRGKAAGLFWMMLGMVVVPTLHTLFRRTLAPRLFGARFEALSENYKIIVAHHATEFVCGLGASPIMALCMCRVLMCDPLAVWSGDTIELVWISGGIGVYCVYSGELAGRLVRVMCLAPPAFDRTLIMVLCCGLADHDSATHGRSSLHDLLLYAADGPRPGAYCTCSLWL